MGILNRKNSEDDGEESRGRRLLRLWHAKRRAAEAADAAADEDGFPAPRAPGGPRLWRERSIRSQWLLSSVSLVALILLLSAGVFSVATANSLYSSLRSNLVSRVNAATGFFNKYANASYEDLYAGARLYVDGYEDKHKVELQILDNTGRLLFSSSGVVAGIAPATEDLTLALQQNRAAVWSGEDPASGEAIMSASEPIIFPNGEIAAVVRCVSSLKALHARILIYVLAACLVALFIMAFVVLSNTIFIRSILAPLQQINDTAMLIAQGRYGVHIAPLYSNEIGALCTTINNMSDAISRSERTKNDFISSVSHELRTPLTAIAGWSETLLTGGLGPEGGDDPEARRGLEIIKDEASRLSRMVEELLDFSRMERGDLAMQMERVDILPDLEDVVFMYMDTLQKEGMTLQFHEDDNLPQIVGDAARLRQVFLNILDNARKHGGGGGRIAVQAVAGRGSLVVSVQDFGHGIAPEDLPHVKDRFYKGRSKARGHGIGLAVADEIVRLHGGRLDIQSKLGEGTTVTITLPAAAEMV